MTDDAKIELVRHWMIKAQHDLSTARKAALDPDPTLDTAIYHCQQAAEKAVKGFLVYNDQRIGRIHDLRLLILKAAKIESSFAEWADIGDELTPYATAYRYPGDLIEPSIREFQQARKSAEKLVDFVLSRLPKTVRP